MTVLTSMCDPSGSTSIHTGVVCGDPSGMTVPMMARCFSCSSFTPPGDSLSARGILGLVLLSFQVGLIIIFVACGCWTRRMAALFLPIIAAALGLFAIFIGNPVGLLTSFGG